MTNWKMAEKILSLYIKHFCKSSTLARQLKIGTKGNGKAIHKRINVDGHQAKEKPFNHMCNYGNIHYNQNKKLSFLHFTLAKIYEYVFSPRTA